MEQISSNKDLKNMWSKYQRKFTYATDISYNSIIRVLMMLLEK